MVPLVRIAHAIHSGVRNTPSTLESVALKSAPGTLPRAAAVNATDDDTVEGSAHR
ncbi:MAG: hypothetical protein BWX86_02297 [Verrucomicrobia bacterium ADurb.Bin122]|nr:MAG: hypothetical protein BWX86_02297 [Verrucomicrobia bacterium ADurb.Bin122]